MEQEGFEWLVLLITEMFWMISQPGKKAQVFKKICTNEFTVEKIKYVHRPKRVKYIIVFE